MTKKVVVILRSPPHGTAFSSEGLRIAIAMGASEIEVTTIGIGDGVYTFLKDADMTEYERHIHALVDSDCRIVVDEKSLEERGLKKDDLLKVAEVLDHDKIVNILSESNATFTF